MSAGATPATGRSTRPTLNGPLGAGVANGAACAYARNGKAAAAVAHIKDRLLKPRMPNADAASAPLGRTNKSGRASGAQPLRVAIKGVSSPKRDHPRRE